MLGSLYVMLWKLFTDFDSHGVLTIWLCCPVFRRRFTKDYIIFSERHCTGIIWGNSTAVILTTRTTDICRLCIFKKKHQKLFNIWKQKLHSGSLLRSITSTWYFIRTYPTPGLAPLVSCEWSHLWNGARSHRSTDNCSSSSSNGCDLIDRFGAIIRQQRYRRQQQQ